MVGGKGAVNSGALQEDQLEVALKSLGFAVARSQKEEQKQGWDIQKPPRYARGGDSYYAPTRPNTNAKADWRLYVDGGLDVHIESKAQVTPGSTSAKAVAAVLELAAVRDLEGCDVFLVLPSASAMESFSNCDRDYYLWAIRLAEEYEVPHGDVGSATHELSMRYREVRRMA